MHDAQLLREGRLAEIDCEYVAEELEDMGAAKERELESRLGVLMAHLLKWIFQPERRGNSSGSPPSRSNGRGSFVCYEKNLGLKSCLDEVFVDAYADARLIAVRETNLPKVTFLETAPFVLGQVLDDAYWPE